MSEYNIQMNKYNALSAGYDQLYPQPMKHANTHAKDGNDPITPSMIGTYTQTQIDTLLQNKADTSSVYTKTESDTLLAGKAPAGYGLGGQSKFISSSDDLNDVVYDGWYYFDAPPINAPLLDGVNAVGYSSMLVSNRIPSLYVTQEIFCYISWEAFNCVLRRCRINGEWKPWEWVNPPMILGIEYRTTERYLGKPVYALCANFGANIDGSSMYFGENVLNIVRGQAYGGQGNLTYPWYNGNAINNWTAFFDFVVVTDTSDNIKKVKVTCRASSDASSSYSTNYVVLHYTKSTD